MRTSTGSVSVNEIIKAKTVIERYVSETPLTHYPGLSTMIGCRVFIKHENHLLGEVSKYVVELIRCFI